MIQTPTNIDTFNAVVGVIFSELYLSFPLPRDLNEGSVRKILGKEGDDWLTSFSRSEGFFRSTMDWLIHADYIWHEGTQSEFAKRYCRCVLSPKGLESLKATPTGIGGVSLGERIAEASKAGTLKVLGDFASQSLGIALSMAFK
ncbi:TPA: hypothetical protein OT304_000088 [Pseudomonas aeruginosa]|nr:hypothetical protein [Pseudomonas aeruginosa]